MKIDFKFHANKWLWMLVGSCCLLDSSLPQAQAAPEAASLFNVSQMLRAESAPGLFQQQHACDHLPHCKDKISF